jgi:phosphate transport system substrate-binding protein
MKFFDWSLKNGGKLATELDYVPLPDSVVKLINTQWVQSVKDASGKALWK